MNAIARAPTPWIPSDLAPGTYQVRVIVRASTGQMLGHFSDAVTVVVQ